MLIFLCSLFAPILARFTFVSFSALYIPPFFPIPSLLSMLYPSCLYFPLLLGSPLSCCLLIVYPLYYLFLYSISYFFSTLSLLNFTLLLTSISALFLTLLFAVFLTLIPTLTLILLFNLSLTLTVYYPWLPYTLPLWAAK